MSKIITLSNLERFHGHLNFSGGSGYIKEIATNDTTGNIYVNTNDGKLYYKSNGSWSAITLYSSKPRAKNLVLRVSNTLKYAGLVDPSDANASKIRVRVGNTIYAVETSNSAMWNGTASVQNGSLVIPKGSYVYNNYPITWGYGIENDVEVYVKMKFRDLGSGVSDNISSRMPCCSLVRTGRSANTIRINASNTATVPAVVYYEISIFPYGSARSAYMNYDVNSYSNGNVNNAVYNERRLVYSSTCLNEEIECQWIYDTTTLYSNNSTHYFDTVITSDSISFDSRTTAGLALYHVWYGEGSTNFRTNEPTVTAYAALGDMLNKNLATVIITDFHVKIAGVTVLSFSDLINQFS